MVTLLMFVMLPIGWPLAKLLDFLLGAEVERESERVYVCVFVFSCFLVFCGFVGLCVWRSFLCACLLALLPFPHHRLLSPSDTITSTRGAALCLLPPSGIGRSCQHSHKGPSADILLVKRQQMHLHRILLPPSLSLFLPTEHVVLHNCFQTY